MTNFRKLSCLFTLACLMLSPLAFADPLSKSLSISTKNNRQEADSQSRIDKLSMETRRMLEEYHSVSRELEALTIYNDQLERLVGSQQQEMVSIKQQMVDIETTQREVVPLMLRMVARLDEFTGIGHPFLLDERHLRISQLRDLMDRADVSAGEKYRRVMEAYQIELDYGRTLEAYTGELDGADGKRTVDFLRVGRLSIYYQTLDGRESGHWNSSVAGWEVLPNKYTLPIRQGLRIARKQAAPDLLRLPLPVNGKEAH